MSRVALLQLEMPCPSCEGEGGGVGYTCDNCDGRRKVMTVEGVRLAEFIEEYFEVVTVMPSGEPRRMELRRKR